MGVKVYVFAVREVEPNSEGVPPMTMRHKVAEYDRELDNTTRAELHKTYIHNATDYLEYEIERT